MPVVHERRIDAHMHGGVHVCLVQVSESWHLTPNEHCNLQQVSLDVSLRKSHQTIIRSSGAVAMDAAKVGSWLDMMSSQQCVLSVRPVHPNVGPVGCLLVIRKATAWTIRIDWNVMSGSEACRLDANIRTDELVDVERSSTAYLYLVASKTFESLY